MVLGDIVKALRLLSFFVAAQHGLAMEPSRHVRSGGYLLTSDKPSSPIWLATALLHVQGTGNAYRHRGREDIHKSTMFVGVKGSSI